jgi:hypothetical protein
MQFPPNKKLPEEHLSYANGMGTFESKGRLKQQRAFQKKAEKKSTQYFKRAAEASKQGAFSLADNLTGLGLIEQDKAIKAGLKQVSLQRKISNK